MLRSLFSICIVLCCFQSFAQDTATAYFEHKIDTVNSDTKKGITKSFRIIVPGKQKLKDIKIEFQIQTSDFSPSEIFVPNEKVIKIGSSEDTIKKEFNVKFQRNSKDDRLLTLKLFATDKDGNSVALKDSNIAYKVYIKPQALDTLKDASIVGSEFWLFTGTNLDVLDGIKAKELYFKGSYLVNFKTEGAKTKSWLHITFGKNRYFSDKDSIPDINFRSSVPKVNHVDSMTVARGFYDTFRENYHR